MVNYTQVIILAGGLGTRLYPLSVERPKSLLPVCNVSLLARLLGQLQASGFSRAVLALPPVSEYVVERALAADLLAERYDERIGRVQHLHKVAMAAAPQGFDLAVAQITSPLGSQVSAVRELLAPETAAVLVIYGDSLLSLDFGALMRSHVAARAAKGMATIVWHRPADLKLAESEGKTYHGVMSVDGQGRVTRFVEKPPVKEICDGFDLANAAVFICERTLIEHPDFQGAENFSYDLFEPAVNGNKAPIYGFCIGAGFRYDLGSIARFFDANLKLLRGELVGPLTGKEQRPQFWVGEDTTWDAAHITPPVLLGKDVSLGSGARIGPDVVIGDGCQVAEGATIRQAVLLENCHIGAGSRLDTCVLGRFVRIARGVLLPPYAVLGAFTVVGGDHWPNWAEVL